jgi:hypothetical protein
LGKDARSLWRQNSHCTGVEITRATKHESPLYPDLLKQTAKAGFTMREVSADKGYISQKNLLATVDMGAAPFYSVSLKRATGSRHRFMVQDVLLLQLQAG